MCPVVLLLVIFLFFHKDFLYCRELPYDILCPSRSDGNRRADGGRLDLQQYKMSCPPGIFSIMADVCEAFCFLSVFCGQMPDNWCTSVSIRGSTIVWLRPKAAPGSFVVQPSLGCGLTAPGLSSADLSLTPQSYGRRLFQIGFPMAMRSLRVSSKISARIQRAVSETG